jgi:Plasmid pRiA4b ORF-3-like protein
VTKKATKTTHAGPSIYQIKVTLEDSEPPIWRRIQVPGDISLRKLHTILQTAMGWETQHLHEFIVGREHFGEPDPEYGFEMQDDRKTRLDQAAPRQGDRFMHIYDFGDGWRHELTVEKIELPKPGALGPMLIGGERACPPEDCGGVFGYADFLEATQDPDHPDHEELLAWIGGSFDPDAFDADAINRRLKRMK